jgi:hypothetical protein
VALVAQPDHFEGAVAWYLAEVLPFIDDYAPAPSDSQVPEIGASRFSAAIAYQRQTDEVRLLLWALADAMLVASQAKQQAGEDVAPLERRRLPLIRALWWEEADAAARAALGLRGTDVGPQLEDPGFSGFLGKLSQARDGVESAMRRFLKLPEPGVVTVADGLQIAMAARAAEHTSRRQSQRAGCGTTTAFALVVLGALAGVVVKALL